MSGPTGVGPDRLFDTDRDTLLEFLAWCHEHPETWIMLEPDESRYAVSRFLADFGIACDDYAPDALAPDLADRDVCTTCHFREADHGRPIT